MLQLRTKETLDHGDRGWLKARHHFVVSAQGNPVNGPLGALPRHVVNMVLGEASSLSAAAIAIGVGASVVVTRFVKSMLFGITPSDPATLWGAAALLMIVALCASWIPARRAASVQPIEALRRE